MKICTRSFRPTSLGVGVLLVYLIALGCSRVPELVTQMENPDVEVRRAAVHDLARLDPPPSSAISALEVALDDSDSEVRRTATITLGNMGAEAESAIPALTRLFEHEEFATRFAAALAVQRIDPTNTGFQPVLIETLEAGEVGTIVAVGEMGADGAWAIPHLEELLKHRDPNARILAAQSLGQIGPAAETAEPALRRAASDSNAGVREAATQALDALAKTTR